MALLRLNFVREARSGQARLYENGAGARMWIPRSVCPRTMKYPAAGGGLVRGGGWEWSPGVLVMGVGRADAGRAEAATVAHLNRLAEHLDRLRPLHRPAAADPAATTTPPGGGGPRREADRETQLFVRVEGGPDPARFDVPDSFFEVVAPAARPTGP